MDCQHHGASGMSSCPIACCHESCHTLATAVIFVMPEPVAICLPSLVTTVPRSIAATEFAQSLEPLSPPPRTPAFSL